MKEVFEYLFGRLKDKTPITVDVAGQPYAVQANGTIGVPIRKLKPQFEKPTFNVGTLTALADLVNAKVDNFSEKVGLHVVDHLHVRLVALEADDFGDRHVYAQATHEEETRFTFNEYLESEKFLIDFRTSFFFNDEAVKVQTVVSTLESGQTITTADDGLSQSIEMKAGTLSKSNIVIPAEGIALIPWRTFRDAAPVESKFLLRLKGVKDGLPKVALFDIDQKWKLDTVASIAAWLRVHAGDVPVIA